MAGSTMLLILLFFFVSTTNLEFVSSAPFSALDDVPSTDMDRVDMFEGDIAGVDLVALKRNGILNPAARWPNGIIPYTIDPQFSSLDLSTIHNAIDDLNRKTNVKFVPRKTEKDFVAITRGASNSGCYSYIGKTGGQQPVNLESGSRATCIRQGLIQHELTHAIGFFHEQSRTDRDQYVEINYDNIAPEQQSNFRKYSAAVITPLNTSYDYNSLMHYGKYEFALNRNVYSIRPKAPNQNAPIGQRAGLSAIDIQKINLMYPVKRLRDGLPHDVQF